jgi:hypothetical protein
LIAAVVTAALACLETVAFGVTRGFLRNFIGGSTSFGSIRTLAARTLNFVFGLMRIFAERTLIRIFGLATLILGLTFTTTGGLILTPAASAFVKVAGANSIRLAKAAESISVAGFMAFLLTLCGDRSSALIDHRMTPGELKRCVGCHIPVTPL